MLILPKLEVPEFPLTTRVERINIEQINSYLQSLIGYFYSCNAPVISQDQPLNVNSSITGGSTTNWPDVIVSGLSTAIIIGFSYTGGDIVFKARRRSSAAGTAVMIYSAFRIRDNAGPTGIVTNVSINFTPPDANTHTTVITLTSLDVQSGDTIRLDIARLGGDAGDTLTGNVENDGLSVSFV